MDTENISRTCLSLLTVTEDFSWMNEKVTSLSNSSEAHQFTFSRCPDHHTEGDSDSPEGGGEAKNEVSKVSHKNIWQKDHDTNTAPVESSAAAEDWQTLVVCVFLTRPRARESTTNHMEQSPRVQTADCVQAKLGENIQRSTQAAHQQQDTSASVLFVVTMYGEKLDSKWSQCVLHDVPM